MALQPLLIPLSTNIRRSILPLNQTLLANHLDRSSRSKALYRPVVARWRSAYDWLLADCRTRLRQKPCSHARIQRAAVLLLLFPDQHSLHLSLPPSLVRLSLEPCCLFQLDFFFASLVLLAAQEAVFYSRRTCLSLWKHTMTYFKTPAQRKIIKDGVRHSLAKLGESELQTGGVQ